MSNFSQEVLDNIVDFNEGYKFFNTQEDYDAEIADLNAQKAPLETEFNNLGTQLYDELNTNGETTLYYQLLSDWEDVGRDLNSVNKDISITKLIPENWQMLDPESLPQHIKTEISGIKAQTFINTQTGEVNINFKGTGSIDNPNLNEVQMLFEYPQAEIDGFSDLYNHISSAISKAYVNYTIHKLVA